MQYRVSQNGLAKLDGRLGNTWRRKKFCWPKFDFSTFEAKSAFFSVFIRKISYFRCFWAHTNLYRLVSLQVCAIFISKSLINYDLTLFEVGSSGLLSPVGIPGSLVKFR